MSLPPKYADQLANALEEDAQARRNGRPTGARWPEPMREDAFIGLAGEFVGMVEPHTEADRHGLLLSLLAAAGNAIGRGPGFMADGAFHPTLVWPVLLGETSLARKGTAWARTRETMSLAMPEWAATRIEGGLSSGEGLVSYVRDEVRGRRKPRRGEMPDDDGMVEDVLDPGVADKRLLVVETEFAQPFRVMQRDGNTLSPILRSLWDFGQAGGMTKKDRTRVTNGHVTIVGHITVDELRTVLSDVDVANGLVNRFLFCCVRRARSLPDGGFIPHERLTEFAERLRDAIGEASHLKAALDRTDQARQLWYDVYDGLTRGVPGPLGQATTRGAPQVVRLSLIYALLDGEVRIHAEHLQAGLAVWAYCRGSAAYIFGEGTGNALADRILAGLRAKPSGMTRTETICRISDPFPNL